MATGGEPWGANGTVRPTSVILAGGFGMRLRLCTMALSKPAALVERLLDAGEFVAAFPSDEAWYEICAVGEYEHALTDRFTPHDVHSGPAARQGQNA